MTDNTNTPREITFRVRRFDPDTDTIPHWDEFRIHVHDGMTVLEALHKLKAEQTPTLAYRSSCRMGVCGSCGMYINSLPMLACQTQVLHLGTDVVTVAPLPNYSNRSSRSTRRSSRSLFIPIPKRSTNQPVNLSKPLMNANRSASSHTASNADCASRHARRWQLIRFFWDHKP
jgi:hypothetical protein